MCQLQTEGGNGINYMYVFGYKSLRLPCKG